MPLAGMADQEPGRSSPDENEATFDEAPTQVLSSAEDVQASPRTPEVRVTSMLRPVVCLADIARGGTGGGGAKRYGHGGGWGRG